MLVRSVSDPVLSAKHHMNQSNMDEARHGSALPDRSRRRPRSRPQTFFWELTVVILFFALSGAITLQLFAAGNKLSRESAEQNHAMLLVESAAEAIAASGSSEIALPDGGTAVAEQGIQIAYNKDFEPCQAEELKYQLVITAQREERKGGSLYRYQIAFNKADGGVLYQLDTTRYYPEEEGLR